MRAAWYGYWSAYHSLRSPAYFARAARVRRLGRVHRPAPALIAWWHIPGTGALEREAAANGLLNDHLRIHKAAKETRKARGTILALCLAVAGRRRRGHGGVRAVVGVGARRRRAVRAVRPGRAAAGQDDHHEGRAARAGAAAGPGRHHPRARLAGHRRDQPGDRATAPCSAFPSPVREDGPGWRAEVDLPYGVTAAQVIDRREQLASGLRRPLGAVWPEPVTHEHAGRLELWVGRADISKAKPAAVAAGCAPAAATCSPPLPFGTDVRGRARQGRR